MEQGNGTQTANVDFTFPITLTGSVYLFHYRNQTLGTVTPVGLQRVDDGSLGSGRLSIWRVTAPSPSLTTSGANALVSWVAIKVSKGLHVGSGLNYEAANPTPPVLAPVGGGTAPALACYACNNNAVWTVPPGAQEVYRDTHAEARPSIMAAYFPVGPVADGDRGLSGTQRIEGSGSVWW